MPRRRATPNFFRNRAVVVAVVAGGHVALLALLIAHHVRDGRAPDDERMALVFIDPRAAPTPTGPGPARPARTSRPAATRPAAAAVHEHSPGESAAITPGVDWYAQGSQAAARATQTTTTRRFENPPRGPAPREKKEFHWDKTHTERVHALEGGGIGVSLSDNCELVIAPFPMAGCALGKRKARGDLFDEMKAPPEMGDWKDR